MTRIACLDSEIGQVVDHPDIAAKILQPLCLPDRETFCVMFLDRRGRVIVATAVADGTENAVAVDMRIVLRAAIVADAAAMIVAHNHPSGNPVPSDADIYMTRKLIAACDAIGVLFVDHLVLTTGARYQSISAYLEAHPRV